MSAFLVTLALLVLLCLRIPVAFAILFPSLAYLVLASNVPFAVAVQQMVSSVDGFALLAVPLFILVGNIANVSGIGDRIFDAAQNVVGRFRGGLGYVNVLSSLGFSWMSGTALSDVAVMGAVQVPQMQKRGYSDRFTAGITAAGAMITPTMPPSLPAIMFGVVSGVSIGGLFAAAIVPAFALTAFLLVSVWFYARGRPELVIPAPSRRELIRSIVGVTPALVAPVIIMGGILGGLFTPTEAAAVAVAYLLLIGLLIYRSLGSDKLRFALAETVRTLGSVMFLVATSTFFGWILTVEHVPAELGEAIRSWTDDPQLFMVCVAGVLLLIGTFMEPGPAILITTPVLMPIADSLGVHPLQFGFLMVFTLLIGLYTPPVGLVLFVLESVSTLKSRDILLGVAPFLCVFLLVVLLVIFVPQLTLWLPSVLMN